MSLNFLTDEEYLEWLDAIRTESGHHNALTVLNRKKPGRFTAIFDELVLRILLDKSLQLHERHYYLVVLASDIFGERLMQKDISRKLYEITPFMNFLQKYIYEWSRLGHRDVDFSAWSHICEEGLNLLLRFIKDPKRQKRFLVDDEFDAFMDRYKAVYNQLAKKYLFLNYSENG